MVAGSYTSQEPTRPFLIQPGAIVSALHMFRVRKRPVLASLAFAVITFVVVLARKVFDYAAPPAGPKDCNFIFPLGGDETKPRVLTVAVPQNRPVLEQVGGYVNDASCLK